MKRGTRRSGPLESIRGEPSVGELQPPARGSVIDRAALQVRNQDLWVFGYGSLIWQPGFAFVERQLALVRGFHRSACLVSVRYRGSSSDPGLVLGLEHGGSCKGMVFRIAARDVPVSVDYLWQREMITQAYRPRMLTAITADARHPALAFTVDRQHPQYRGGLALADKIAIISTARGASGSNSEYLLEIANCLRSLGIHDRALERLVSGVLSAIVPGYND